MNPDRQYQPAPAAAPPPAGQPGQYDFITNPPKPPKKGLLPSGSKGILALVAGAVVLLLILFSLASLIFGGDSNKDVLMGVARKQSEIIEIAGIGVDDGGSNNAKALGQTVLLTVTTQQQNTLALVEKPKAKEYAAKPSAEVVKTLDTAQQNGRFDEVFGNVIKQELSEYQQTLQNANNQVSGPKTKQVLAENYDAAGLLLLIKL